MSVLALLKTRRNYVATQISEITKTTLGGKPNANTADGGTTIDHVAYRDSLYRELRELDAAIQREAVVAAALDDSDGSWEIESQVYS
jgi:hypothetical protein